MNFDFESVYRVMQDDFDSFRSLILEKNRVLNLTRITSDEDFKYKNIEDSIAPLFLSQFFSLSFFTSVRNILDIGTGGGFPLLPLAMLLSKGKKFWENFSALSAFSDLSKVVTPFFYGLDSVKKKISAVSDVAVSLNLEGIEFLSERVEVVGRDLRYRANFDCVTSRAVAEIPVLLEYSAPLVKIGGLICMYKSSDIDDELRISGKAAQNLGVRLIEEFKYHLSNELGSRTFLVYRKTAATSLKYPRNIGVAKKNPII